MVVLAREASVQDAALVLVIAELATFLVRSEPTSVEGRLALFVERLVEGLAAVLVFHGMCRRRSARRPTAELLFALAVAARRAASLIAEIARMVRERTLAISAHGRMADVALVTSATLMAISAMGVEGSGGMGLWGPAVFTIPLLAAWYSYEHLEVIRRTYDQTIRALGAAPELGGMVRDGHAERVADLAVAMGRTLGFSRSRARRSSRPPRCCTTSARCASTNPTTAARPSRSRSRRPAPPSCAAPSCSRPPATSSRPSGCRTGENVSSRPSVMSGQILKVASAFDELSDGHADRAGLALEALCSAPEYLYDARVLARARDRARPARSARRSALLSLTCRARDSRAASPGTRLPSKHRSTIPSAITMSPIENCWFGKSGRGDHVAEEAEQVVVLLRTVLHRLLDRDVHLPAVALAHVVLRGHALVQRDHEHVERHTDGDERHAAH